MYYSNPTTASVGVFIFSQNQLCCMKEQATHNTIKSLFKPGYSVFILEKKGAYPVEYHSEEIFSIVNSSKEMMSLSFTVYEKAFAEFQRLK